MKKISLIGLLVIIVLISGCAKKIEGVIPPEDILEGNIPEITNYPKLEQVFVDLYSSVALFSSDKFSKEEIDFMEVGLKIYKEKPKLKEYPREVLHYLMSRYCGRGASYDAEFFNQTLIPLAKEITVEAEDDLAAIKAIHEWVNDNMVVDYVVYIEFTPKNILREKRGVCTEYSTLIVALSKAVGIPARAVSSQDTISGSGHTWVEVYIDGDWIPIASTGALDLDKDGLIEYSELKHLENNKMVDVFIKSPYYVQHGRLDITFGYNNYIVQQMIAEVQGMLEENYNLEAKNNLESAKDIFSLWEKEKSTEKRNKIGREAIEYLLRAVAILKEDITGDEVQVAFLEDFPILWHVSGRDVSGKWREITPSLEVAAGLMPSGELKNPFAFGEGFQKTLVETNPKALYLFDATYKERTEIGFHGFCRGIDFCMLKAIDELIKNEGLDTDLNFVLYWLSNDSEKIEFLNSEDIKPVTTLTEIFHDNALDFMQDFIGAVNSMEDDNATKMSFYLPSKFEEKYNYHITATGTFIREDRNFLGYSLKFVIVVETSIGELPLELEISNVSEPGSRYTNKYTNLIIVDESGNVLSPEEKDGKYYYPDCPSTLNLDSGQNLIIERQGDFIKITETGKP